MASYPIFVSPPSSKDVPDAIKYVEFKEFKGQEPAESKYIKSEDPFILKYLASGPYDKILDKLMIVKFNDSSEGEIKEILLNKGIECEGCRYYFLGHSDEQLKNKTCYVMCPTQEEVQAVLSQLTDFSRRISVADRASEIGAWFSECRFSLELKEEEFEFTNYNLDHCDTGICGFMSTQLSKEIQELINLPYPPDIIRIIHENCNGWLLRSDCLKAPIKVCVDKSTTWRKPLAERFMRPKAGSPVRNVLGICDIARPYTIGYLDARAVLLLAEKGVSHSNMETLQNTYYDILSRLEDDRTHALFFLCITGNEDLRGKLHETSRVTDEIKAQLKLLKEEEIRKMRSSQRSLRVLVPRAREVVGVPDPYSRLKSGECVFNSTLPDGRPEKAEFKNASKVLVIPRPCYNPTEVRVLKLAKDRSAYEHLKDCLVFSTESNFCGKKPLGNQSKTYFVTWDPTLIPPSQRWWSRHPRMPISIRQTMKSSPETRRSLFMTSKRLDPAEEIRRGRQELVEYFASFKNFDDLLYRTEEMYKKFALLKGPSCKECCQLDAILSGRMNLSKESQKAEKMIAQLEKSCKSPGTGGKPGEKEEGAVGVTHKEESLGVVDRMERNAREYIAKGRLNIR